MHSVINKKKSIRGILLVGILAAFFFIFVQANTAQAATVYCSTNNNTCFGKFETLPEGCSTAGGGYTHCNVIPPPGQSCTSDGNLGYNCTVPDTVTQPKPALNNTDGSCDLFGGGTGIANCLSGLIYVFTVGLGSGFAWIGASFLNYAVHLSLDSAAYALDFVATGWTTARDIANMAFIFILIYLAVTIMFQAQTAHSMQTLAGVIVIALIINFSFFFTRLVVDAGNLLSVQFYNAIIASNPTITVNTGIAGQVAVPDITASIMEGLDLQKALASDSFKQFAASQSAGSAFGTYLIAMSFIFIAVGAMFFMLAATFLTAGVKFLIRIVVLWFMIIAAPLALAVRASGIHSLEHYYKDWQSSLIKHAFYPVAFLFVFWILSKFMGDMNANGNLTAVFNDINNISANGGNFIINLGALIATIAIRLGFVIAILYVGIRAADRVGTMGAAWAQNFGQKVSLGGLSGYTQRLQGAGKLAARPVVAPVTQFAGMGAYDLNKALSSNRTVRKLSTPIREGVLQPLSKASVVGEKSFVQLKNEAAARSVINKAIKNPDALTEQEKKQLNHTSTEVFATIAPATLERLINSHVISDEGKKHIDGVKNFTEDEKHSIDHAWDDHKAGEDNKYLQDIDAKLGGLTTTVEENGTQQTIKIIDVLKANAKLDKKNTNTIKKALEEKGDAVKAQRVGKEEAVKAATNRLTVAQKTGANIKAAEQELKDAETALAKLHNEERNINSAVKRLDKTPKEKSEKADDKH